MRSRLAHWLVRSVSEAVNHAYEANCLHEKAAEEYWMAVAQQRSWRLRFALFLDKEAAVDQMIEEGWWG